MLRFKPCLFFLIIVLIIIVIGLSSTTLAISSDGQQTQPEILSLGNCLDIALKNSPEIQAAAQNVKIAREQVRQAEGGLLPVLGYEITGSNSNEDQIGWSFLVPGGRFHTKELSTGSISLTQPLYTGGRLTQGIKMAKLNLETAIEDERKTRQTLTFNVKAAYYQAWLAEQRLKVAEASYDNLGRHVQRVESFYEVGKASKFDLLRAEVQHENLKPALIKAQNGVVLTKLNLTNIIGLDKTRQYRVEYDLTKLQLPGHVEQDPQTLLDQAYQNRPELQKFQKMQEMAKVQTAMAYAGYKPTVAIVGTYEGVSYGEIDPGAWKDNSAWTLVLDVKGNFFDGFITQAKISAAKLNQKLVIINETKLRDGIYLDVEQALQNLSESLETSHANQANMELAKESLEMTEAKFEARMATTMDVRDSQVALDQALNGYYEGVSAYLTALAKLDLAVGKESL
jgi:outer membrane protein TolC